MGFPKGFKFSAKTRQAMSQAAMKREAAKRLKRSGGTTLDVMSDKSPTEGVIDTDEQKFVRMLRAKADHHYRLHEHYICCLVDFEKNGHE